MPTVCWTGQRRSTRRSIGRTSTRRRSRGSKARSGGVPAAMRRATQGAWSNYTNLRVQPADHAIGRSRGGLSRKIHQLVDGAGLPLVVLVTRGQAGDSPMFEPWQPRRQAARLRRRPTQGPQRRRARLQQHQTVARHRHRLRPTRRVGGEPIGPVRAAIRIRDSATQPIPAGSRPRTAADRAS
jgi:hypothetical protein